MNKVTNKLLYFFPFLLFVTCCTLVRYNVPIFVHTWPWILMGCVVSLLIKTPFIRTMPFFWLLAYMMVVILNFLSGDKYFGDIGAVANEFAIPFLSCSLAAYILNQKSKADARVVLFPFLAIIIITAINTEIIDIEFPGVVRAATAWEGDESNQDMLMAYWRLGMSNYLLPHALPVLVFPCIIGFFFLRKTKNRVFFLVVISFLLLLVYLGGSTTALLLTALSLLFALINRKKMINTRTIVTTMVLLFPFIVIPELLSGLLGSIASIFSGSETGSEYAYHLLDIKSLNDTGSSDNASFRLELYRMSIQQFFDNILIGTQAGVLGGHSAFFDRFGTLGLVGGIPLIGFFISYFRYVSKLLSENYKGVFLFCYMIGFIMLVLKNMWNVEMLITMLCILPIMISFFMYEDKRSNIL